MAAFCMERSFSQTLGFCVGLEIVLKCFKISLFFCNYVVERFRLASDALYILFLLFP